jgi:hypothetical protein
MVVEGEGKCQSAERLFPDFVGTSWMGGANALDKAEWSCSTASGKSASSILPTPVTGWYDPSHYTPQQMPPQADLLQVNEYEWEQRWTTQWHVQSGGLIPYVPPPLAIAQQAHEAMFQPVTIVSGHAELDGQYPMLMINQRRITTIASAISAGLGLPGDRPTFNWADVDGAMHPWPAAQFSEYMARE